MLSFGHGTFDHPGSITRVSVDLKIEFKELPPNIATVLTAGGDNIAASPVASAAVSLAWLCKAVALFVVGETTRAGRQRTG